MPTVKTAISIRSGLFHEVERLSHELGVSRSQLFALAAEDFVKRHRNKQLLKQINEAHVAPDKEEKRLLSAVKRKQRKLMEE